MSLQFHIVTSSALLFMSTTLLTLSINSKQSFEKSELLTVLLVAHFFCLYESPLDHCIFTIQGLKLELCTTDRVGLLSDVTRIFRESSLTVTRAEVATRGGKAVNTFYVRGASGYPVDTKTIDSIRQAIGQTILQVKGHTDGSNQVPQESPTRFLFGGLFKSRSFCNFGLVRSYS